MTGNPREGFQAKQGVDNNINIDNKFTKAISTSRQWSAFRNPRIFRVSRSFGGKDRHSKVYTVRGLRDRRIRLSVPTAIQLYDLQDKLNLSQPSKVIDWLLEATKLDIDKLPPLQMPQGVAQFYQQTLLPHHHHHLVHESSGNFSHEPSLGANFYGANSTFFKEPRYWDRDNTLSRLKEKQEDERVGSIEKGKWVLKTNDQENEDGNHGIGDNYNSSSQVSAGQKLFPIIGTTTHTSLLSGMLNGNAIPYNSSYHISEPNSNLSLMSHFGSHGLLTSQVDNSHQSGGSGVQFPSGYSQFLFCPPYSAATPSLFGPYSNITASSAESEPSRSSQFNHIQFLSSTSHPHHIPIIPSTFSFKRLDSDHNNERTQSDHKNGTDRS